MSDSTYLESVDQRTPFAVLVGALLAVFFGYAAFDLADFDGGLAAGMFLYAVCFGISPFVRP
ncbi:hypothetical protein AB5J62_21970 [Amycolatopsis sp. cg5]|uniref:hypothetical protein n=1 Tax=Amycolatopsis sp. cg5 TaxID=3238802 RepID=UPI0035257DD3